MEATVLQFTPPYPVYRIEIQGDLEVVVTEPLMELGSRQRIAIPNPWRPDDERYLPGIAYGKEGEYLMDVGQAFGSLVFHETTGWVCQALVPKKDVMPGVAKEMVEQIMSGTFTERLIKRTSKKKKKTKG